MRAPAALAAAALLALALGLGASADPRPPPRRRHRHGSPSSTASPPAVSLWPQPQSVLLGAETTYVDRDAFTFTYLPPPPPPSPPPPHTEAVAILEDAFLRYAAIIFGGGGGGGVRSGAGSSSDGSGRGTPSWRNGTTPTPSPSPSPSPTPTLTTLVVAPASLDDTLQLGTDESYTLTVPGPASSTATLACQTVYGCLRGLETFSQLVLNGASPSPLPLPLIPTTPLTVADAPRFPHRGLLLDSSRHFTPVPVILQLIDSLAYTRGNVLHWHLTDEQSFPLLTTAHPELAQGAWDPSAVYTPADLATVVRYAKYRGVRVVPELDNPAHSHSWSVGRPDLVAACASPSTVYNSVLDPSNPETYEVLASLFAELASIFPDRMLHIGGDEVTVDNTSCWNTPAINAWMAGTANISAGDYKGVARYHLAKVQEIVVGKLGRDMGVWEEVLDHYGDGPNPTTIPAFLNRSAAVVGMWFAPDWQWFNLSYVVEQGFRATKHNDWYLDDLSADWMTMYARDPLTDSLCVYPPGGASPVPLNCSCPVTTGWGCYNITDPDQVARVLGGEASAWGEEIDAGNLFPVVWPRTAAVLERLWSPRQVNDPAAALPRLADHVCRLRARGVESAPVMPNFCDGSRR